MKKFICTALSFSLMSALLLGCGSHSYDSATGTTVELANGSYAAEEAYAYNDGIYDYSYDNSLEGAEYYEAESGTSVEVTEASQESARKLITTMDYHVETSDFEATAQTVENKVASLGGYVESSYIYTDYNDLRCASYILRIPEKYLDEFTSVVEGATNVISKNRWVEDVTLTYVDIESRMGVYKTEAQTLENMLSQAEDIETMLAIERELSEVQATIESMESQLRSYDNQISYSTVNLELNEVYIYTVVDTPEKTALQRMKEGFVNSLVNVGEGLKNFGIGFVIAFPYIALWAVIIFLICLIITAIIKKHKKNKMKRLAKLAASGMPVTTAQTIPQTAAPTAAQNVPQAAPLYQNQTPEK